MKNIWAKIPKEIGWIGQFGGLVVILILIRLEIKYEANVFLLLGTIFSFVWAVSTKIAHARRK